MANNGSVSVGSTADDVTWIETFIWGLAPLILGICGVCVNIMTIIAIISTKKLRSHTFILLACHACYCFIMAAGFMTIGIETLRYLFNFSNLMYPRLFCFLRHLTQFWWMSSSVVSVFLALDRFCAIAFSKKYKDNSRKLIITGICLSIIVGMTNVTATGLTIPGLPTDIIYCYSFYAVVNPIQIKVSSYFNSTSSCIAITMYAAIFGVIKYRKYQQKINSSNETTKTDLDRYLQKQLKLLPVITVLMIAYACFSLVPAILISLSGLVADGKYQQRTTQYANVVRAGLPSIDFCVLMTRSHDFFATVKAWCKKKKPVTPHNGTY